mmetsp:Transcript_12966/g.20083  ORF Transcript_12966/g.20083 Transcript_12966/m.20083 type:complete len:112 (-) Transcript_12966:785-1120(-)
MNYKAPGSDTSVGVLFFKAHHSFCDGVSIMCLTLAMSEEFSRDYFIKSRDASLLERIFVRVMMPFKLPQLVYKFSLKTDNNFITHRREDGLSGVWRAASAENMDFRLIKAL